MNLNSLREILSAYADSVKKGLNKFGILNSDFSDYRDTKLAYIFSILTDDLSTTLSDKDLVDVKNLHSLISCLNRVDKVIDPVLLVNEDIVKFVREHKITNETELKATFNELNSQVLNKWASKENLKTSKILLYKTGDGENYLIDGSSFFEMISELNQLILFQSEKMSELTGTERRKVNSKMDLLYGACLNLYKSAEKIEEYIKINSEKLQILNKIIEDYSNFKNKIKTRESTESAPRPAKVKKENLFKVLVKAFFGFFASLFRFYAKGELLDESDEISGSGALGKKDLSHETTKIYKKTINMNAPIVPLSDFVELIPENDYLVNRIIKDMRENNLKIVVPIYNARENLYPKRSQKILMPDIEYLLISPEKAKFPETIREFTDWLVGKKIKDEILPSKAIIAIEKYLLTLYRQRKTIK